MRNCSVPISAAIARRCRRVLHAAALTRFRVASLASLSCVILCGFLVLPLFATNERSVADLPGPGLAKRDLDAIRSLIAERRSQSWNGANLPVENVEDIVEGLAELEVPGEEQGRRDLAEVWLEAAHLARICEGDSPLFYEAIRTAASLDPDNQEIAREAEFQRHRQEQFEQRLAAAKAERERRAGRQ